MRQISGVTDEILKDSQLILLVFSPGTYLFPLGVSVVQMVPSPRAGSSLCHEIPALSAGQQENGKQGEWCSRQEERCASAGWHCSQEAGGLHFG